MKVYTVDGFVEVGKNMTVVETGDDAFIFDCGLFLPAIIGLEENERRTNENKLRNILAVPNDKVLPQHLKEKVRAIFVTHAHLDHLGALPWLAKYYDCPILGSPFTMEVLKKEYEDEERPIENKLITIKPDSVVYIKGKNQDFKVDFIASTHSTIQACMVALHTKEGVFLHSGDFKFDGSPVVGLKPNYNKLREIAKEGVKGMVVDSLYADDERKTASEKVARTLLEDVMLGTTNRGNGVLVTTFSSHIARLKSIVDFGLKLNRQVVFVGRSLNKYVTAAKNANACPFYKEIQIASYRKQVEKVLARANKDKGKYLLVTTGHQGEPFSVLDRMTKNMLPYQLDPNDHVIFSSSVIPAEVNIQQRENLDKKLRKKKVRIFNNVHVSGHGGREDLRDLINMVNPENIIPNHATRPKIQQMHNLCQELGYKNKKNLHLMEDGTNITL